MIETHSNSQNSEKITALTRVSENHEHALQEIQKQLQVINGFMQRMVETKEKRQQDPNSGSHALLVNNHVGNSDSLPQHSIKNLKLEFSRFHGEDPICWVYKANQYFSNHNTPKH